MNRSPRSVCALATLAASVAAGLLAQGAHASHLHERSRVAALSVPQLQLHYLACDRASRNELLPTSVAVHCSMVGDELMNRAFDGDFDRLIAWWRSQRDEDVADAARR